VLRHDEASVDVARYIVNNPIRSKLVERIDDYPFWGSLTHSREELLVYIQRGRLKAALCNSPPKSAPTYGLLRAT
jgi:hypothetical protein